MKYILPIIFAFVTTIASAQGNFAVSRSINPVGTKSVRTASMRSVAPMREYQANYDYNTQQISKITYEAYNASMQLYTTSKTKKRKPLSLIGASSVNSLSRWNATSSSSSNDALLSLVSVAEEPMVYSVIGPGVPDVDEDEIIPLGMGWDVIIFLILLALGYSYFTYKRRIAE